MNSTTPEQIAREITDNFRYGSPPIQSLRFLEWEPLAAAITTAIQNERERCAGVVEDFMDWKSCKCAECQYGNSHGVDIFASVKAIATAIREGK